LQWSLHIILSEDNDILTNLFLLLLFSLLKLIDKLLGTNSDALVLKLI